MDKKLKKNEEGNDDDWIKCRSRQFPTKYYMYNKVTKKTKWCGDMKEKKTMPRLSVNPANVYKYQTPAQDRLKRLQYNIRAEQLKAAKENANRSPSKRAETSPVSRSRKTTAQAPKEVVPAKRLRRAVSPKKEAKPSFPLSLRLRTNSLRSEEDARLPIVEASQRTPLRRPSTNAEESDGVKPSASSSTAGLLVRFKQACRETFGNLWSTDSTNGAGSDASKTTCDRDDVVTLESNYYGQDDYGPFRHHTKVRMPTNVRDQVLLPLLPVRQLREVGRANKRLQHLRLSLQEQATQTSVSRPQDEDDPMDWQPEERPMSAREPSVAGETMAEYYDTVNENLMRLNSERKRGRRKAAPWEKNHYYFVLDTNVLLTSLVFIDELSNMKLCNTKGTILYVPYMVLQELDKLKRPSSSDGAKTLATRAIRFLNEKLEQDAVSFKPQSAADDQHHLIEITSPDDHIINCCLQMKEHIELVVLLTEDTNLRNKAISNGIDVTTKSDLVSQHPRT